MPQVERSFVPVPSGRIHVAAAGSGAPVLLLHQTPRSWDEFRDVLPLLGRHYRAIAMDTIGYGDSDPLREGQASIESWAKAAHQLLTALGINRAAVVGHHTGVAIAVEIAAAYPETVAALVLSASPYVDDARRAEARESEHVIDEAAPHPEGGHLIEFGRCGSPSIRPIALISWSGLSSTRSRQARGQPKAIALLIATKWKGVCRWCVARRW
jgi:pimeloyl-ACP methyl ester carboxylesterase